MQSKKENDITIVVVCGYDDDNRGVEFGLTQHKRFYLTSSFLTDELVKVIMINDTELGIDESMSPHNWQVWSSAIQKESYAKFGIDIGNKNNSVTWYVGEQKYKEDIENIPNYGWHKVKLFDRADNPISGTMCRLNPQKYWNNIAIPFRSYFSHNILISGTASEGKTTLVRDIGKYFGIPFSYEKGRDNCAIKPDDKFDVRDFIYNIYEQNKYNQSLINDPSNTGVFVSDTDNMVTLMYAKFYSERKDFGIDESDYVLLHSLAERYSDMIWWNKIFLLEPSEASIVDDGQRYMPDSDYGIRCDFFAYLKSLYDEFGYEYEILNGTYLENFNRVKNYIKEIKNVE